MASIRTSLIVEVDDVPIPSFPIYFRINPTTVQNVQTTQVSGGGFVAIPSGDMTTIQALILTSDQTVSVAFNGAVGSAIVVTAGTVLSIMGCSITALSVSNASGNTANIRGLVAGV